MDRDASLEFMDKVALVTGGAMGIGKAVTFALLEKGCQVCFLDIEEKESENVVSEIDFKFGKENVLFLVCDVTNEENFRGAFQKVIEWKGHIDIVINNAGTIDELQWREMIQLNVVSCVYGTILGFNFMGLDKGGRGGIVVNISSSAALRKEMCVPLYAASKCAVIGLSKSFGTPLHFDHTGVIVNVVCPDATDTRLLNIAKKSAYFPHMFLTSNPFYKMDPTFVAVGVLKIIRDRRNGGVLKVTKDGYEYLSTL